MSYPFPPWPTLGWPKININPVPLGAESFFLADSEALLISSSILASNEAIQDLSGTAARLTSSQLTPDGALLSVVGSVDVTGVITLNNGFTTARFEVENAYVKLTPPNSPNSSVGLYISGTQADTRLTVDNDNLVAGLEVYEKTVGGRPGVALFGMQHSSNVYLIVYDAGNADTYSSLVMRGTPSGGLQNTFEIVSGQDKNNAAANAASIRNSGELQISAPDVQVEIPGTGSFIIHREDNDYNSPLPFVVTGAWGHVGISNTQNGQYENIGIDITSDNGMDVGIVGYSGTTRMFNLESADMNSFLELNVNDGAGGAENGIYIGVNGNLQTTTLSAYKPFKLLSDNIMIGGTSGLRTTASLYGNLGITGTTNISGVLRISSSLSGVGDNIISVSAAGGGPGGKFTVSSYGFVYGSGGLGTDTTFIEVGGNYTDEILYTVSNNKSLEFHGDPGNTANSASIILDSDVAITTAAITSFRVQGVEKARVTAVGGFSGTSGTFTAPVTVSSSLEITGTAATTLYLHSPNGSRWALTVDNAGIISTTAA